MAALTVAERGRGWASLPEEWAQCGARSGTRLAREQCSDATGGMAPEATTRGEVSQRKAATTRGHLHANLKYHTDEHVYERGADSRRGPHACGC